MKKKRFWLVRLFRLPESAEQQISNLFHRIPEKSLFFIAFSLLTLTTSYLVFKQSITFQIDGKQFLGMIIVSALMYFALYKACLRIKSARHPVKTIFGVAGIAILFQLILIRAAEFIALMLDKIIDMKPYEGYFGFKLAIPFGVASLILSLLIGPQIALICAFIISLCVALIPELGLPLAFYSLSCSIASITGVERYRTRNAVAFGILVIGSVSVVMGLATPLIADPPLINGVSTHTILYHSINSAVLGILHALQATAIASLATPLFESIFGILTDMRLMELSNADNPLLRELAIKTPGTSHHSSIVASLAEAAAKAIGANALLVKTACLYHDIGKMAAPKMYIENQTGMENPHNKVNPRDSVRIVTGHVRRGIKMGTEAGLPQQIVDFIPQHHGTRILAYFYHKAKSQAEAEGEVINPDEFRYPGPKPQTKEAVIVMMADGAEAAVRSLHDHSEENIRGIIKKIIDHIVADGQFDESDVTLKELDLIRESLIQTLRSIYHERVSYPGFNPSSETKNGISLTSESNNASARSTTMTSEPQMTAPTE